MDFLFKDVSFKFATLRAAGFAIDNGADISEILTAAAIPEGDEEAWMRGWRQLRTVFTNAACIL
ncbi:MAG: hypothetical protein P4L79_16095 [Legionella sp.]|uniref:hypothetical protein n=1 Tax=Legionella sp. TaxID=459 RepID=UPI002842F5F4|nr:hypothetical protein [Legionella sp.]